MEQIQKCVMVLDESLPLGVAANTAAILGITLGKELPQVVGASVTDQIGRKHLGIIEFPVPILRGSSELIRALRERLYSPDCRDVIVADFSSLAQGCRAYEEFIEKMGHTPEEELDYIGLVLCGPKKQINKLTGNMPLLR